MIVRFCTAFRHYLITTVQLPRVSQILEASAERPYLSLRLELDPALAAAGE